MTTQAVHMRPWSNGTPELENFPFEDVSDYLEQPGCLVRADLCSPDEGMLCRLAEELGLDRHGSRTRVMSS